MIEKIAKTENSFTQIITLPQLIPKAMDSMMFLRLIIIIYMLKALYDTCAVTSIVSHQNKP